VSALKRLFGRGDEDGEAGALRMAWMGAYAIVPPARQWQAVHLDSGAILPPGKLDDLSAAIRADYRQRPSGRTR
jgi:hypothetical protein